LGGGFGAPRGAITTTSTIATSGMGVGAAGGVRVVGRGTWSPRYLHTHSPSSAATARRSRCYHYHHHQHHRQSLLSGAAGSLCGVRPSRLRRSMYGVGGAVAATAAGGRPCSAHQALPSSSARLRARLAQAAAAAGRDVPSAPDHSTGGEQV
jgi:hypothetical protein